MPNQTTPLGETRVLGDWGSSHLRLWRESPHSDGIGPWHDGPGIGALDRPASAVLRELLADLPYGERAKSITLCGMAGARGGLHEAPYVDCPASPVDWSRSAIRIDFDGIPLTIAAGVATPVGAGRAEVMRGEETQVFGAIAHEGRLAIGRHTLLLPGTHSKWVTIDGGAIVDFATALTGELYAALLRSSLTSIPGPDTEDGGRPGMFEGFLEARDRPGLLGALFQARSRQLRMDRSPAWARDYLSGLLIGNEIAEMAVRFGNPPSVTVIGEPLLALRYFAALPAFGIAAQVLMPSDCTLAGLEICDAHTR